MKPAWFVAFALPLLCTSVSFSQANPADTVATTNPSDAKAASTPAPAPDAAASADTEQASATAAPQGKVPDVTEAELKQKLTGRPLYLRGLWLDETLHFNMNGEIVGQSPKGSFTLCGVFVDHVRVTKKTVELEGVRFGVHFEGEAPWEQQSASFDRIQITPKKKHQLIVIDRQLVVVPKKKKGAKGEPAEAPQLPPGATLSPTESADRLRKAIDKILAPDLDAKMIAEMPDYWQYFYQAQQAHKSLVPTDQSLAHPGPGVDGPRLLKNVVPVSNDYAQKSEVAGVASYKVILDPKGKILAVAVYRPIGFGLDENAVAAIEKSTFAGAVRDGKPVPSVIDLAVNFRIYSKRTAAGAPAETAADADPAASPVTGKPPLPGLFSAQAQAPPAPAAHQ
jgi:hypothetical protein